MSPEIVSLFAEHGLAGLVIGVMFFMIFFLIRTLSAKDTKFTKHIEQHNTQCMSNIQGILDDERDERKETRKDNKASQAQLAKAIDGLAKGLSKQDRVIRKIK